MCVFFSSFSSAGCSVTAWAWSGCSSCCGGGEEACVASSTTGLTPEAARGGGAEEDGGGVLLSERDALDLMRLKKPLLLDSRFFSAASCRPEVEPRVEERLRSHSLPEPRRLLRFDVQIKALT